MLWTTLWRLWRRFTRLELKGRSNTFPKGNYLLNCVSLVLREARLWGFCPLNVTETCSTGWKGRNKRNCRKHRRNWSKASAWSRLHLCSEKTNLSLCPSSKSRSAKNKQQFNRWKSNESGNFNVNLNPNPTFRFYFKHCSEKCLMCGTKILSGYLELVHLSVYLIMNTFQMLNTRTCFWHFCLFGEDSFEGCICLAFTFSSKHLIIKSYRSDNFGCYLLLVSLDFGTSWVIYCYWCNMLGITLCLWFFSL